MKIDKKQFDGLLDFGIDMAKVYYFDHPEGQLIPILLVAIDDGDPKWFLEICVLPDFTENRYDILHYIGKRYGKNGKKVPAIVLISESWMSIQSREEREGHPENRVTPSEDPDRQEIVMTVAMTIELNSVMSHFPILRNSRGRASLGQEKRWENFDSPLLTEFWKGYAPAFLLFVEKRN